jgi:hypothetical protein
MKEDHHMDEDDYDQGKWNSRDNFRIHI